MFSLRPSAAQPKCRLDSSLRANSKPKIQYADSRGRTDHCFFGHPSEKWLFGERFAFLSEAATCCDSRNPRKE